MFVSIGVCFVLGCCVLMCLCYVCCVLLYYGELNLLVCVLFGVSPRLVCLSVCYSFTNSCVNASITFFYTTQLINFI